ncbi:NfrA family protein [Emcibacter nanhaiensis]|uniref:Tetratricopeptide repeat protein n=1 Tax=Emcibacter nanhaiensis TaxID=1505037 RepID=A0A501PG05_9PROT|nr:tetratricopeptide repeat protein [Emcibacter nanhaiensis]TPD59370.1 tetratricopeptide repeat protein [Emcibacter nanhaiensis]
MRTRLKFTLLLVSVSGFLSLLFHLGWTSDVFRQERAWYHRFPKQDRGEPPTTPAAPAISIPIPSPVPPIALAMSVNAEITVSAGPEEPVPKPAPVAPPDKPPEQAKENPRLEVRLEFDENIDQVHTAEKNDWYSHADKGYHLLAAGDHAGAIDAFEQALELNPDRTELKLQLAYSALKLHRNRQAVRWFSAVVRDREPAPSFALRRQIEELENRWSADGYLIYRDQQDDFGPLTGPNLVQSQAGLELSWQPPGIGYNNGRKLALYGRLLWALEEESLSFSDRSYQGGVGLRYKPLSRHNLVLSVERLLEVGSFARNDWMLRAGYSLDHGTDWQPARRWWSWSLYVDAAMIRPRDPDIYLTFQAQGGPAFRLTEQMTVQPGGLVLVNWQQDRYRTAHLVEGGPGVKFRIYFNESRYEAWRSHIELAVDYRFRIAGNSLGGSGPVAILLFHF